MIPGTNIVNTIYTFSFSKDLGMDWTGARPNTAYHSAVICDPEDVRKAPVLYCSSPVVCCDIMRDAFFPVGGAAKGIPLKDVIRGSAASMPRTQPFSVLTCLSMMISPSAC